MTRPVRVLRRAERDLLEIQRYLEREASRHVHAVMDRLLARIEKLASFAESGARPRDAHLRARGFYFVVEGRYLIFYKTTRRAVRVYRILQASRDYLRVLR